MKAYNIYAIALTVAFVIYYAVMIARDLTGKNGDKGKKSGEEEFDVSGFKEEESVSVEENERGFNIGGNEYETRYAGETQDLNLSDDPGKNAQDVMEELDRKIRANTEETHVTFSDPKNADELCRLIMKNGINGPKSDRTLTVKNSIDEL